MDGVLDVSRVATRQPTPRRRGGSLFARLAPGPLLCSSRAVGRPYDRPRRRPPAAGVLDVAYRTLRLPCRGAAARRDGAGRAVRPRGPRRVLPPTGGSPAHDISAAGAPRTGTRAARRSTMVSLYPRSTRARHEYFLAFGERLLPHPCLDAVVLGALRRPRRPAAVCGPVRLRLAFGPAGGDGDHLRARPIQDEGEQYAERMAEAGVPVTATRCTDWCTAVG